MATVQEKITAFRRRIQDNIKPGRASIVQADGRSVYTLKPAPINAVSQVKFGATVQSAATYTVGKEVGSVTLSAPPIDGTQITFSFTYAKVTDDFLLQAYNAARAAAFPYLRIDVDTEVPTDGVSLAVSGGDFYDLSAYGAVDIWQVQLVDAATGGNVLHTYDPFELRIEDAGNSLYFLSNKPTNVGAFLRFFMRRRLGELTISETFTQPREWDPVIEEYMMYYWLTAQAMERSRANSYATTMNGISHIGLEQAAARHFQAFHEGCVRTGRPRPPYKRPNHLSVDAPESTRYLER